MSTPNKSPRKWESPVAWLLGAQLIGGLKGLLLYAAYGSKLDPRDWMTAEEFPSKDQTFPSYDESKTEFWFDYLADAGDGTRAMYSIAYLALSSVWTKLDPTTTLLPATESERKVSTINDGTEPFSFLLPRGEFLFIGGDTSYHEADYMTLFNRIQHPFNYAYEDLRARNLISDSEERRPIFAIPGNHDYYDQLDGFRRQFRKPVRKEGPFPPKKGTGGNAQLTVAGFKRVQEASYVAIRLPFGWRLWGLDTESPSDRSERSDQNLDVRQEDFFTRIETGADGKYHPPAKLILATCSPSTVCGLLAKGNDRKVARPQEALELARPFLSDEPGKTDLTETGDKQLTTGQCRLDLSGDVHHYARYWGPTAPGGVPPRKHNTAPRPEAKSYASVVSGLGGAFHHPSTTYDDQICEQVLYPSEDKSREAFANRLFKFWNVLTGGRVWLFGFIIAFTIYFGASVAQSGRQFLGNIGVLNTLRLTSPQIIEPTVVLPKDAQPCAPVQPFKLWTSLGVSNDEWRPSDKCSEANPTYIFTQEESWPWDFVLGQVLISLSLIVIFASLGLSGLTKNPFIIAPDPAIKLWPMIGVTLLFVLVGFASIKPYREHITPFGISILVLFSLVAAIAAILLSLRYADYRFKKSFVPERVGDRLPEWASRIPGASRLLEWASWLLEWACWLVAVVIFGSALWFFSKYNSPALLVSDILFLVVVIASVVGIMFVLPFKTAGDLLYTKSKTIQFVGKSLIGIWHVILQLLVPYILIRHGNYLTWAVAAILLVLPIPLAQFLLKKDNRIGLSLMWLVYGSVMLTLPWSVAWILNQLNQPLTPVFYGATGWTGLWAAVIAGVAGAIISCLWTGWYFAICLGFNGHNSETGGAARIEEFKQFIRFRLTPDSITGYVIGIDDVSKVGDVDSNGHTIDGSDLDFKLIDVFHLVPKA